MPTVTSSEKFMGLLEKSKLLTAEQLDQVRANTSLADNPKKIALRLVGERQLTRWQAERLLSGRHQHHLRKYRLLDLLSGSSPRRVYLAWHPQMQRRIVLKILSSRATDLEQAIKEIRSVVSPLTRLDHNNVVQVHNVERIGDHFYLVSEYVDGTDSERIVRRDGALTPAMAGSYIEQAAEGLAHLHDASVIHGNLQPSHLLVDQQDGVKILNAGLAPLTSNGELSATDGSLMFAAPEQALGSDRGDSRADIYSLGCIWYYLLTGQPPFAEADEPRLRYKQQLKGPPSIVEARIDGADELDHIFRKVMAPVPGDRYQSASEMAEEIREFLTAMQPAPIPTTTRNQGQATTKSGTKESGTTNTKEPGLKTAQRLADVNPVQPVVPSGTVPDSNRESPKLVASSETPGRHDQPRSATRRRRAPRSQLLLIFAAAIGIVGLVTVAFYLGTSIFALPDQVADGQKQPAENPDQSTGVPESHSTLTPANGPAPPPAENTVTPDTHSVDDKPKPGQANEKPMPHTTPVESESETIPPDEGSTRTGSTGDNPIGVENLEIISLRSSDNEFNLIEIEGEYFYKVTGSNPNVATYEVVARAQSPGMMGFMLETMYHPTLPLGGPGRSKDGNFVITEIRIFGSSTEDFQDEELIPIERAFAHCTEPGFPETNAIDGRPETGWSSWPEADKVPMALFVFSQPLDNDLPYWLRVELEQQAGDQRTLGLFRIRAVMGPLPADLLEGDRGKPHTSPEDSPQDPAQPESQPLGTFANFARAVELPPPPEAGQDPGTAEPFLLGEVSAEPDVIPSVELHCGDVAMESGGSFSIRRGGEGLAEKDWDVHMTKPGGIDAIVSRLALDDQGLTFQWTAEAADQILAGNLRNCALQLGVGQESHVVALRKPIPAQPIPVEFSKRPASLRTEIESPPRASAIKMEITRLEGEFPSASYDENRVIPARKGFTRILLGDGVASGLVLNIRTKMQRRFEVSMMPMYQIAPQQDPVRFNIADLEPAFVQMNIQLGQMNAGVFQTEQLPDAANNPQLQQQIAFLKTRIQAGQAAVQQLGRVKMYAEALHGKARIHYRLFVTSDGHQVELANTDAAGAAVADDQAP